MKKLVLIFLIIWFGVTITNIYGQDIPQKTQTVYFPSFYHLIHDPGTVSLGIGYEDYRPDMVSRLAFGWVF
jgi:hypothetical protein